MQEIEDINKPKLKKKTNYLELSYPKVTSVFPWISPEGALEKG